MDNDINCTCYIVATTLLRTQVVTRELFHVLDQSQEIFATFDYFEDVHWVEL